MSKPIFILAGQSNARRLSDEVTADLTARYGADGYILVQAAIGGAALTYEMADRDDWATASELPAQVVAALQDAVQGTPDAHVAGMIWIQGESDSRSGANPDVYRARLQALIDRIEAEVPTVGTAAAESFATLPVAISQLAESSSETFERVAWDTIILKQARLAADRDNITAVDPDALAREAMLSPADMFVDNVHYSAEFSQILAARLIDEVLEVQGHTPTPGLTLRGDATAEEITGSAGDDLLRGRGGADTLTGEDGDDRLIGGKAADQIFGGAGDDILWGYRGNDRMEGGAGDDRFFAGIGNDVVLGGAGADYVKGGGGKDTISGGDGADLLYGGSWRDTLTGGNDDDLLVGGAGQDILSGGEGHDVLVGGRANLTGDGVRDVFVFEVNASGQAEFDRIKDFEAGVDQLDLSAFGYQDFAAVLSIATETAYGVELALASDHGLLLQDFQVANFSSGDVIL